MYNKRGPFFWKRVCFSDESTFQQTPNCRPFQWIPAGQEHDEKYLHKTLQQGGKKITVWGMITWNGTVPLVVNKDGQSMDKWWYKRIILQRHVVPYMKAHRHMIFQEDNAKPHTATVCKVYRERKNITRLYWPARSPDLNPIEHCWY